MRVTRLKPSARRPGFVTIEADGARLGVLPIEEVKELGLKVELELTDSQEEQLRTRIERGTAYLAGVRLLAVRGRAVQEVVMRLRRKGLRPDAVEHAVGRLESEGLLDDEAFAQVFARVRAERGFGRNRVLAELSRKGVERHVAERAAALVERDADEMRPELEAIARKRLHQMRHVPPEVARRRLMGFLVRRGFGISDVRRVVAEVVQDRAAPE